VVVKVGRKWEVAAKVGTEFEVVMCENGKWRKVCEKQEVVVKVGAESEVATCENGKWWSK
jgi:hypothetical protein